MKILVTGANGYIGMRLIPTLLEAGHHVVCAVRDERRIPFDQTENDKLDIIEIDFLRPEPMNPIPADIDAAYYLIHSMTGDTENFDEREASAAHEFNHHIKHSNCKQVIYLSGIVNDKTLSKHLKSRKTVEEILGTGTAALTALRAGIVVGSGSASFEIIRDLCEKLPVMVTPRWVNSKCQPIAIRDVISFLSGVLGKEKYYNQGYDIGGPDVLTYKEMMQEYASVRKLNLYIVGTPFMSPRLSSRWLYLVTRTSYKLAVNLVDSMKVDVVAQPNSLAQELGIDPLPYRVAIEKAFEKIEQNLVASHWKDALYQSEIQDIDRFIETPRYGCVKDEQKRKVALPDNALERIWDIGGNTGWYYATWLWKVRGFIDKLVGGVGTRRGRTNNATITAGDAIDFWRVVYANKKERKLLLYAEMKVPGEAWLEFRIDSGNWLYQTATFRPRGLWGRLYWWAMLPFHYFIFSGMINRIAYGRQLEDRSAVIKKVLQ